MIVMMVCTLGVYAGESIGLKWQSNKNCEACHQEISAKWETSRHANSHFSKNDLFRQSLAYMVQKNPTSILDEVKVSCAKCHNPRLAKSGMSDEEKVGLLLGDSDTTKSFHKMLNNKNMKNGINCVVCHNVESIHLNKKEGSQGMGSITFGEQGTMFGPFDDAISPYHKTAQRDHFVGNNPKLCFACHFSAKNKHGVEVYATGKEYEAFSQDKEGCKDCHMSKPREGYASNHAAVGEKPKKRMVRTHRFASVDNSNIMTDYVDIKAKTEGNTFVLTLKNRTPHNIPTGYGLREILLKVTFLDKDDHVLKTHLYRLGATWKDAKGELTIPHLATTKSRDTRLKGLSTVAYKFPIAKGAVYAKYSFSYRLVSEGLAKAMGVTDPFFLKEYKFLEQRIHL